MTGYLHILRAFLLYIYTLKAAVVVGKIRVYVGKIAVVRKFGKGNCMQELAAMCSVQNI
jgi:hypothetical protein